jgi:hypothetical protein
MFEYVHTVLHLIIAISFNKIFRQQLIKLIHEFKIKMKNQRVDNIDFKKSATKISSISLK